MKSTLSVTIGLSLLLATSSSLRTLAAPAAIGHAPPKGGQPTPAQSAVAAKTPFAKAPASAAKGALSAKDLAGATKLIGKTGSFQGTVSEVYSPQGHGVVILDFDPDYRSAVTAIARPASYAKLPNLKMLKGKHILVSGKFESYKGKPEIEVSKPSQIKLLP